MKIQVLPNNKGQLLNPFDRLIPNLSKSRSKWKINLEWDAFDKTNPAYDIINPLSVKVGETVSATLVWQARNSDYKPWRNVEEKIYMNYLLKNDIAKSSIERTEIRKAWQLPPVKEGEEKPLLDTPFNYEGNWTEDFSHENGNYSNTCILCDKQFLGHKRRVACKICSHPAESDNSQYRMDPVGVVDEICPADITGDNLKSWRKIHGFTLREVQKDTGISNPYLSQLETGKIKRPSFDVIAKLVILYGKTLIIK